MTDVVARCGGVIEARAPEPPFRYALPDEGRADVIAFLAQSAMVQPEPGFIARVPGVRLFGGGAVISPDGKSVARDVSLDFGKPFSEHWLIGYADFRPPILLAGRTAVVSSALGGGYCHWLLEELPRLLSLTTEAYDTVFAHETMPFTGEAWALGGMKAPAVVPRRLSHFVCEHAVIPSLVAPAGWPTPQLVQTLREFVRPLERPRRDFGEKIFISRENARRRRIANEPALWAELERRGFSKLRLEELTWAEQIAAFSAAKIVVAPHGAGLANLVFSSPGTRVIECFNPAYVDGYFWRLAAVQGLHYRPVVNAPEVPLGCELSANRLDIEVDVDEVLRALA